MTNQDLAGPSGSAAWELFEAAAGTAAPGSIMLLPDAANRPGIDPIYHAILATPRLAYDTAGDPLFSLTLVLARPPRPDEQNISPLILHGNLTFEVILGLSPDEMELLEEEQPQAIFHPLFVRQGSLRLQSGQAGEMHLLSGTAISGSILQAALTANLSPAETLDVLSALEGVESDLHVSAELSFRVVHPPLTLHLAGSWAEIYDFLTARLPSPENASRAELRQNFHAMLIEGILSAYEVLASGAEQPVPAVYYDYLFDIFMRMSSMLVDHLSPELESDDEANRYSLRERPHPMISLDIRQVLSGSAQRRLSVEARLDALISGALQGLDRGRFIHLVTPGVGGAGMAPAPRRLRTGRTKSSRGGGSVASLALVDGEARSVSLAMRPASRPLASDALIASDVVTVVGLAANSHSWWVDDLILIPSDKGKDRNLPVVDDPNGVVWRDRIDPQLYWYPPVFEILQPVATADPQTSPFLFTYRRTGTTSSGKPALMGNVQFKLQKKINAAATTKLVTIPGARAQPLPTSDLSISLSVPFIDDADGLLKRSDFTASLAQAGDIVTVQVELINDWVRLCYGVLSEQGFQSENASLQISYTFQGYVPVRKEDLELVTGGKLAHLPVVHSGADPLILNRQPYFDAVEAAYRHPLGEVRLKREEPEDGTGRHRNAPGLPGEVPVSAPRMSSAANVSSIEDVRAPSLQGQVFLNANLSPVLVSRPKLRPGEALDILLEKMEYATRSFVRQNNQPLLFPCRELGALYQETLETGNQAIGCRDALQLGSTTYRQYEEIPELADERCRVYRSLQQPGRFLVLPASYRITRYAPGEPERAYQPVMIVYSVLDPEQEANNRVVFQATLQADLPPFAQRALLMELAKRAAQPILEYPTVILCDVEYTWALDRTLQVEPSAVRTPDSFQVSLATDLPGALLLRSILENGGFFGGVHFKLPDGTTLNSNLFLDLRQLTGPWEAGPLKQDLQDGNVRLTNKIESPIEVSDLLAYPQTGTPRSLIVEAVLTPGALRSVPLDGASGEVYPVYEVLPGNLAALEEIRSVVEDVHTNVIFIDLINYNNHNLSRVDIQARLKDFGAINPVAMNGDPPRGAVDFILPLTVYLEKHILQYRVTKTFQDDRKETTPWLEWDLRENGNIISLSWDMIQ